MEKTPEQHDQVESKLERNIIEYQIVSADINRALAIIATRQINAEDHWTREALCSAGVDPNIFDPLDKDIEGNEKSKTILRRVRRTRVLPRSSNGSK